MEVRFERKVFYRLSEKNFQASSEIFSVELSKLLLSCPEKKLQKLLNFLILDF